MSTIAWDGKILAADRKMTCGNLQEICSKITRLENGTILAWAGGSAEGLALAEWFSRGADPSIYPAFQADKDRFTSLIVIHPDGVGFEYEQTHVPLPLAGRAVVAWGSGMGYALGAMAMGANAIEAVEIASQFDPRSGFGVESYSIEDEENG